MPKHAMLPSIQEHPRWCSARHIGPEEHDPHTSPRERIAADFPSDTVIGAYLVELAGLVDLAAEEQSAATEQRMAAGRGDEKRRSRPPMSQAPLVALEFTDPGEEPVSVLLTFTQLRRLHEALGRLLTLGRQR